MKFKKYNFEKKKFRLRLNGFDILKNEKNLGLWRNLKEQFLIFSPLEKGKITFYKYIFGSSYY